MFVLTDAMNNVLVVQSRHSMFHASGKGTDGDDDGDEEEDEEEEKPEISEEEQERVARQKKLGREAKQVTPFSWHLISFVSSCTLCS